ncbi:MAG: S-adenosylmethionine decarboxylase, partial [Gammaproteobacteria bacterium]|nr:S-adenosylmethionine decarboxylase [Gammaproteobacteria bacterium]
MHDNNKIQLSGFNNLTKTLSFNIYDVSYLCSDADIPAHIEYVNDQYSSSRLTGILRDVARIIGANVLNVATADYEPAG